MLKSLLWKTEKTADVVASENKSVLADDLKLTKLLSIMSKEPNIRMTKEIFLSALAHEEINILYRQCILMDFLKRPEILSELEGILILLEKMKNLHKMLKPDLKVPAMMLRLRKLELYLGIMEELELVFTQTGKTKLSEDFIAIGDEIRKINRVTGLKKLLVDIAAIKNVTEKIKSIDIGINIDHQFDARESIITSINDYKYEKSNIIDKISCNNEKEIKKLAVAPEIDIRNAGQLLSFQNVLYQEFESLLNREMHIVEDILLKHEKLVTSSILTYRDEISLYYGAVRLVDFMNRNNHAKCYGVPSKGEINYRGLYSMAMAFDSVTSEERNKYLVVENDLLIRKNENTLLITGANDGGKTVLLESIGIAQLLFQNGLIVPAKAAKLQIYDKIFSHFPKDEDISIGAGRLGEEAGRVSKILQASGQSTLVLFNEPYITTSPLEGLDILVMSIKRFMERGSKICLVTHYLDILSGIDDTGSIASYVMEIKDGIRTYKALQRVPMSKSHAIDVAKEHGVDAKGIIKMLRERRNIGSGEVMQ